MDEKINNIIPTLFAEMESDRENESKRLLAYYLRCIPQERDVVNNVLMYICGWTFETLLEKCGLKIDEGGEPIILICPSCGSSNITACATEANGEGYVCQDCEYEDRKAVFEIRAT
jgi:predicted RNA-binding Zn-ribbon protein involved in translation (DUF1610 family)